MYVASGAVGSVAKRSLAFSLMYKASHDRISYSCTVLHYKTAHRFLVSMFIFFSFEI